MAVNKITGTLFTDIEKLIGVSKASIASVSGITASTTPAFITANLRNRYTPANYSGTGNLLDEVGNLDMIITGATYSSTAPANFDSDGINDSIIAPSYTQADTDMSWGLWYNPDSQPGGVMINGGYIQVNGQGSISYRASSNTYSYYRGPRGINNTASNPSYNPSTNAWTYLCWSRNSSTRNIRMWKADVNGVTQLVNITGTTASASTPNTLAFISPAQSRFNGQHGNFHIYTADLGTADWTQNFNAQKAYYGL
tara:strand:+ start:179 stop:940 length:762 start_codon:yes stop_codon:yes gene_type:complete